MAWREISVFPSVRRAFAVQRPTSGLTHRSYIYTYTISPPTIGCNIRARVLQSRRAIVYHMCVCVCLRHRASLFQLGGMLRESARDCRAGSDHKLCIYNAPARGGWLTYFRMNFQTTPRLVRVCRVWDVSVIRTAGLKEIVVIAHCCAEIVSQ